MYSKGVRMLALLANVSSPFPTPIVRETLNLVGYDVQDVRLARSRVSLSSTSCGSLYVDIFLVLLKIHTFTRIIIQ